MTASVLLTPEAEQEIAEAFEWYEQRATGLGSEFLRSVDVALSSAARNPALYPSGLHGARRVLLRRFPYAIFFKPVAHRIVVFACFHGRRDPKVLIQRGERV